MQNIEMILRLIPKLLGNRPWFLAVHDAVSKLSGEPNLHVHLMFSDRPCDGFLRSPQEYFSRANSLSPELGGAPKLTGGKPPFQMAAEMREIRKLVANHMNEELARLGHFPRIDHRSHEERGLDYAPEPHLGASAVESMSALERNAFIQSRFRKVGQS